MLSSSRPLGLVAALLVAFLFQSFIGLVRAIPIPDGAPPTIDVKDGLLGQDMDFWLNDVADMFAEKDIIVDLDQLKGEAGYNKMMNDPAAKDITPATILDQLKEPEDKTQSSKFVENFDVSLDLNSVEAKTLLVADLANPVGRSDDVAAIMAENPGSVDARTVYKSEGRNTLARIIKAVAVLRSITPTPAQFSVQNTARELGNMAGGAEKLAITRKTGTAAFIGSETVAGQKSPILDRIIAYFKSPGKPNIGEAFKNDPAINLVKKGVKKLAGALKFQSDGSVVAPDGTVSDPKAQKPGTTTTNPTTNPGEQPATPEKPNPQAPAPPGDQEPTPHSNTPETPDPSHPNGKPGTKPAGKPPKRR